MHSTFFILVKGVEIDVVRAITICSKLSSSLFCTNLALSTPETHNTTHGVPRVVRKTVVGVDCKSIIVLEILALATAARWGLCPVHPMIRYLLMPSQDLNCVRNQPFLS